MTGCHCPSARSRNDENTFGLRSKLLGVMMMSGRIDCQEGRLTTQQMEILRCSGGVGDADIGLDRRLQKRSRRPVGDPALDPHNRGAATEPEDASSHLALPEGHVFVNDGLGGVDEVAILRFPKDQPFGA